MAGANGVYNLLFRKTSTFALTVVAASFIFERAFDLSTEYVFDQINKGKMWKDIKQRYA